VAGVISENSIRPGFASRGRIIASSGSMLAILHSLGMFVADLFKPRCRLEAENLFLRHQLSIALRRAPRRFRLRGVEPCGFVTVHRFAQLAPLRERSFSHHQGVAPTAAAAAMRAFAKELAGEMFANRHRLWQSTAVGFLPHDSDLQNLSPASAGLFLVEF
jgi:hypothetical protein